MVEGQKRQPAASVGRIPAPCSSTSMNFRFRPLQPPFLRHFRHARRHEDRSARTLSFTLRSSHGSQVF